MNRFFTLLLAASCLTAVGQVPDYVPADGLQVWCAFDGSVINEADDDIVPTSTGAAAFATNRFTEEGKSLSLDGINDEVKIDMALTESVSVSLWFAIPLMQSSQLQPNYSGSIKKPAQTDWGLLQACTTHKISD